MILGTVLCDWTLSGEQCIAQKAMAREWGIKEKSQEFPSMCRLSVIWGQAIPRKTMNHVMGPILNCSFMGDLLPGLLFSCFL